MAGSWFRSYLSERQQTCFIKEHSSNSRFVRCGIPQGTILGPLLFLIYINDFPNCLKMFADDIYLTYASNNIYDINNKLNEDLANVTEWLSANIMLTLNQSKSEFMLIDLRQRIKTLQSAPSLAINGVSVRQVAHTKSLGTYIDENLSWNVHVEKLCKNVSSGISSLLFPQCN